MSYNHTHTFNKAYEGTIAFNGEITSKSYDDDMVSIDVTYASYDEALSDVRKIYFN